MSHRPRRYQLLVYTMLSGVLLAAGACAHFRGRSSADAVAVARRAFCGPVGSATDVACTVRELTRVPGGYRVIIDRRPPAGDDRVAVSVSGRSGRIEVEPMRPDRPTSDSLHPARMVWLRFDAHLQSHARKHRQLNRGTMP